MALRLSSLEMHLFVKELRCIAFPYGCRTALDSHQHSPCSTSHSVLIIVIRTTVILSSKKLICFWLSVVMNVVNIKEKVRCITYFHRTYERADQTAAFDFTCIFIQRFLPLHKKAQGENRATIESVFSKKFHGTPTDFLKDAALCERRNTASFPHTVAGQLWILTSIPHSFPFMIYMHDTLYDSHTVKKYLKILIKS